MSLTSHLSELARFGAEAIRISFRLGIHVYMVSQGLEPRPAEGPAESWAYVFVGLSEHDVQRELEAMNASMVRHPCRQQAVFRCI